jgi:hypothetical protein
VKKNAKKVCIMAYWKKNWTKKTNF